MTHPGRLFLAVGLLAIVTAYHAAWAGEKAAPADQYRHGDIVIPAATADEPVRMELSLPQAADYLEKGALAWTKSRKCVSCHTNGVYQKI